MMTADNTLQAGSTSRPQREGGGAAAAVILFLAIFAGYSNSFHGPFVYDDLNNIVLNQNIHASRFSIAELSKSLAGNEITTRPLSHLSFAINHSINGLSVFGYHIVNVSVHVCSAIVLFFLFRAILSMRNREKAGEDPNAAAGAFLAALLWAVSPIQVNAVTFIVQRMTSFCALFFFLSLWCYVLGRCGRRQALFFCLCGLFFFASLGFKENAVLLPLNFVLVEMVFLRPVLSKNQKIAVVFFFALFMAGILGVGAHLWESLSKTYSDRYFTLYQRLLTEPRVLFFHLGQMAFPWHSRFALLHDFTVSRSLFSPWTTLPAIAGVFALVIFALFSMKRRKLLSFAILFFFLNHALEGTVLPLELVYEHRNYIPSTFLFLPIGAFIAEFGEKHKAAKVFELPLFIATGLFVLLSIFSVHEINGNFSSAERLWLYHVRKYPDYSLPHSLLADAYWNHDMAAACAQCRAAVEAAHFNSKSQTATALANAGICRLYYDKDPKGALILFAKALPVIPDHEPTLNGMAVAQLALGNFKNAETALEMGLSILPGSIALAETQALLMVQEKRFDQAAKTAEQLIAKNPGDASARSVLGAAYSRMGDHEKSAAQWALYLKTYPMVSYGIMALIHEYLKSGKTVEAGNLAERLEAVIPPGREEEFIDHVKADPVAMLYVPLDPDFWSNVRRMMDKNKRLG